MNKFKVQMKQICLYSNLFNGMICLNSVTAEKHKRISTLNKSMKNENNKNNKIKK